MKKVVKILLIISIVLMTVVSVSSQVPNEIYSIAIDDSAISIEHKGLSQDKLNVIIENELEIDTESATASFNLLCIFGHSTTSGSFTLTSHSVSSSAPRCRKYLYNYEMCTRSGCDYYSSTLIFTEYLYCH